MPIKKRLAAADKYKPSSVGLLLVAEAPPCTLDRYFYFEDVDKQDSLFRCVWEGLSGENAGKRDQKAEQLGVLRDNGVFLIDLHEENVSSPKLKTLQACVPGLIDRCTELEPEAIVLIKSVVYDAAYVPLALAGLPVIDARLPFPGSGQQRKFIDAFAPAVHDAGFRFDAGPFKPRTQAAT